MLLVSSYYCIIHGQACMSCNNGGCQRPFTLMQNDAGEGRSAERWQFDVGHDRAVVYILSDVLVLSRDIAVVCPSQ